MTAKLGEKMWHKRHHDFECYDKITFEIVPRYKESGLSGDEWRQHVEVTFWFKGHAIYSYPDYLLAKPNGQDQDGRGERP